MGDTGTADHSCKGTFYSGAIPVHCKIVGGHALYSKSGKGGGGVVLPAPAPTSVRKRYTYVRILYQGLIEPPTLIYTYLHLKDIPQVKS